MRADEFLPRRGGHTLWSCWEAMPFQDIPHGLVTDRIAQISQGADDPVLAPGAVLLCHTDDQGLDLLVVHRAAGHLALLSGIPFLVHELPGPAKNRVGLDDRGHVREGPLSQLLANL